jgi:rod shape-determining protein MreC
MGSLFQFLFKYRLFFLFVLLELLCSWLILNNNANQRIAFISSSNSAVAKVLSLNQKVQDYFALQVINSNLADENARLNAELTNARLQLDKMGMDTTQPLIEMGQYTFKVAKVINNSVSRINNYLTLDKGTADGITKGMGVISPAGVVGSILVCSEHFSTATSLLHSKMLISAEIKRISAFGTVKWTGGDPTIADLDFIAPHLEPQKGDTIITSEYSSILPNDIMVGVIDQIELAQNGNFYKIKIKLATDFSTLGYVYIVENKYKAEKDSLQYNTSKEFNE